MMGIGAVKGVEIGEGFGAARLLGSEMNDPIGKAGFATNHCGRYPRRDQHRAGYRRQDRRQADALDTAGAADRRSRRGGAGDIS